MNHRTERPGPDEHAPMFAAYIARVPAGDIVELLRTRIAHTRSLVEKLTDEQADYAYEPGKWTIREVIGHLADTERVMAYRTLTAARADSSALPSFDENAWVPAGEFGLRSLSSLIGELETVRAATVALFDGLPEPAWHRRGSASGRPFSVRAMATIIAGHERHHGHILETRYGLAPA